MCPPLIAAGIAAAAGIASAVGGGIAAGNRDQANREHDLEMYRLQHGGTLTPATTDSTGAPPISAGQAMGAIGSLGAQMGGAAARQPIVYAPGAEQVRTPSGHLPRAHLSPQHAAALSTVHAQQQQQPLERHQEQVGRAVVNRTTSQIHETLAQIRQRVDHRARQVQATAEHRAIEAEQAFRRRLFAELSTIKDNLTRALRPRRY